MSEWGPWSPCSADKCNSFGVEERHRVVLGHPVNGGMKCPHLLQSKQCQALPCEDTNHEGSNNIIVSWRQQHLLQHYHNQQQEGKQKMFRRGDEHNNVRQSQHQHKKKQQQKQSNQRERMNKQDIKNNKDKEYKELPRKNKQHEEAFNEHYQHNRKHLNKKQKEYSRQVWKGRKKTMHFISFYLKVLRDVFEILILYQLLELLSILLETISVFLNSHIPSFVLSTYYTIRKKILLILN